MEEDPAMVPSSKLASAYYPHRPLWLRAVNTGGDVLQRLGMSFGQFDVTRLLEAACRNTGLHDFGTIPFQEPLQLLLRSCEHEARLNLCGQMALRHDVLRLLRNRLRLEDDWKQDPGIAAQCIERPSSSPVYPGPAPAAPWSARPRSCQPDAAELGGHVSLTSART